MRVVGSVSDVLARKSATIWNIAPQTTVFDAIQLMAEKNVGALLVMDGNKLVGLISERDYTRKVVLHGHSSKQTTVRDIMTAPVVSVSLHDAVADCLHLMTDKRVRHLPVVMDGKVIGVMSIGDLVKWVMDAQSAAIEQMENYIGGGYSA